MHKVIEALGDTMLISVMLILQAVILVFTLSYLEYCKNDITRDKTALQNFSGYVNTDFTYDSHDLLLSIVIADEYQPEPSILNIEDTVVIDARLQDGLYEGENSGSFLSTDRLTFIRNNWSDLKTLIGAGDKSVKIETREKGDGYEWFATITR